jgi:hypothetical protein
VWMCGNGSNTTLTIDRCPANRILVFASIASAYAMSANNLDFCLKGPTGTLSVLCYNVKEFISAVRTLAASCWFSFPSLRLAPSGKDHDLKH